jgi:hypothetical protein
MKKDPFAVQLGNNTEKKVGVVQGATQQAANTAPNAAPQAPQQKPA